MFSSVACLSNHRSVTEQVFHFADMQGIKFSIYVFDPFDIKSKTSVPMSRSQRFSIFFPKNFRVLQFVFRSLNHFELILIPGMEFRSRLIFFSFCPCTSNNSSHHLLKRLLPLHGMDLHLCQMISEAHLCGSVSGFLLLSY